MLRREEFQAVNMGSDLDISSPPTDRDPVGPRTASAQQGC
jgi:hypothetical protein